MSFVDVVFAGRQSLMLSPVLKTAGRKALRLMLDLFSIIALFIALIVLLQSPWRDVLVSSNKIVGPADDPTYRSVFVQIDDTFLDPELPLTLQLAQWGALLTHIQRANPAAILVDYQFSAKRFDTLLPGHADQFEQTLLELSQKGILIMGLASPPTGPHSKGFTLDRIEEDSRIKKACMVLDLDHDRVMRDFQNFPSAAACPVIGARSMAGLAAELLGAEVKTSGLVLTRGLDSLTAIQAGKLLQGAQFEPDLRNAIVVVGSNFPFEDEVKASHQTGLLATHPNIKGGLVHALNTEALLENRIAWNTSHSWIPLAGLVTLGLFLWSWGRAQWPTSLWVLTLALLALELAMVNLFKIHMGLINAALLSMACALWLTGKRVIKSLLKKRQIQHLLGSLLSPAVFEQCMNNPEAFFKTRRFSKASVLVLDLKGYSRDANHLDLATLFSRTNQLLAACTQVIHQHGGCVERFRGDGLLAYFGAPLPSDHALDQAIDAAKSILALLEQPDQTALHPFHHRVRFGLSAGEVILGKVGDERRFDLAVTGLAANRAAHFESLADPEHSPIVVDELSLQTASKPWSGKRMTVTHPKHPELQLVSL